MPETEAPQKPEEKVDLEKVTAQFEGMRSELEAEKQARAELQGKIEGIQSAAAQPASPPPPQPKKYTRGELNAAVEAGTISAEQRDAYLDKTLREELRAEMQTEIEGAKVAMQTETQIKAELDQYKKAIPSILEKGTEDRARVQAEYDKLVSVYGQPQGEFTELLAVKNAFGPVPTGRSDLSSERESDQAGGGGGAANRGEGSKSDPLNGIEVSQRHRNHYAKLIDRGLITPEQAREELSAYTGPASA